ncbi:Ankyrin repeat, PH and SEC7 domain containing protein secG [Paramyrothecium foliicola]|nr:Ankyrin repeat, PH and SEC7 domain containing protein secG [Paramyrothecium foliicola]
MWKAVSFRAFFALILCRFVAADDGDDFTNNLVTDLGPLLSLFGERVTQQFMSQSMGWADNFILAMLPIGIITIIVSAIRVRGPAWLRGIIGRARENLAAAETEIMSSTSNEVCELWNGSQIVRCMGSAPLTEFICLLPKDFKEDRPLTVGTDYLQSQIKKEDRGSPAHIEEFSNSFGNSRASGKVTCLEEGTQPVKDDHSEKPLEPDIMIVRNTLSAAPNMTLNSHKWVPTWMTRAVAIWGTILQLGVLLYGGFATYSLRFRKDDQPIDRYGFPLATLGTVMLVLGILICAHVVESSTGEKRYRAKDGKKARLIWLQQTKTVGDQSFESYAIYPQDESEIFTTSMRLPHADELPKSLNNGKRPETIQLRKLLSKKLGNFEPVLDVIITFYDDTLELVIFNFRRLLRKLSNTKNDSSNTGQSGSYPEQDDRTKWLEARTLRVETVLGTALALSGYIAQFIGLRAMHFSVSIGQLIGVIIMVACRAMIRLRLSRAPRSTRLTQGFELDWLVLTLLESPNMAQWTPDDLNPGSDKHGTWRVVTGVTRTTYMESEKNEGIKSTDAATQLCGLELPYQELPYQELPTVSNGRESTNRTLKAHSAMLLRRDLGRLASWRSPASAEAISLARAIEVVMNILFAAPGRETFVWSLPAAYGPGAKTANVSFRLTNENGIWKAEADELDAALSLWLYSVNEKEQGKGNAVSEEFPKGDKWLRAKGSPAKSSLRLLGPYDEGLHRDLWWWMPDEAFRVITVEEDHNGDEMLEIESHRVVGSGLGAGNATQKPLPIRYSRRELARLDFNLFDSRWKTGARSKEILATESYGTLGLLYAQDLFSAFMEAAAEKMQGPINGQALIRGDQTTGSESWLSCRLQNDQLSRMAQEVQNTGLGSLQDIYLSIVPPLSVNSKLPQADAIMRLIREEARLFERGGRWKEAANLYLWLFRVAKTFPEESGFSLKATAILLDLLRRLVATLRLRSAQRAYHDAYSLDDLKRSLVKELGLGTRAEVQARAMVARLMTLYELQGHGWTYVDESPEQDLSEWLRDWLREDSSLAHEDGWNQEYLPWTRAMNHIKNFFEVIKFMPSISSWAGRENNLKSEDKYGRTLLHYVVAIDNYHVAELLLQHDPPVNACDLLGWTPLHYAAAGSNASTLELLAKAKADVNARDLVEWTPLHFACKNGHEVNVRDLLKYGANINAQGRDGVTPLHCAAMNGHSDIIKFLMQAGSSVDVLDAVGNTALLWAVKNGHKNAVMHLWPGSNQNLQDPHGRTSLHLAVLAGAEDMISLLLDLGAEKDPIDRYGATPLYLAVKCRNQRVIELLVKSGVSIDAEERKDQPLHLAIETKNNDAAEFLIRSGADVEAKGLGGVTSLHVAVEKDNLAIAKLLTEHGAKIDARTDFQGTPLHFAAMFGSEPIAKLLIENGADLEATSVDGAAALHYAVSYENLAVARALVDNGANTEAKMADGDTPRSMATGRESWELLWTAGWRLIERRKVVVVTDCDGPCQEV